MLPVTQHTTLNHERMISHMFKTMIIGNLTRDPELRTVNANGEQVNVCTLGIAVNERIGGQERTTFIDVSCWRGLATVCSQYLKKGSKVYVDGAISINTYTDRDGQFKATLRMNAQNVEFLTPRANSAAPATPAPRTQQPAAPAPNYDAPVAANAGFEVVEPEDLPF